MKKWQIRILLFLPFLKRRLILLSSPSPFQTNNEPIQISFSSKFLSTYIQLGPSHRLANEKQTLFFLLQHNKFKIHVVCSLRFPITVRCTQWGWSNWIIGCDLPTISSVHSDRVHKGAVKIIRDCTPPLCSPAGRCLLWQSPLALAAASSPQQQESLKLTDCHPVSPHRFIY